MKLINDYLRLIIFAAGILVGVQVPNFIDQYAKRISAHYIEAKTNFSGYQQTADKHFNGDISALLNHYGSNPDAVFKDDAKNIQEIYKRRQAFETESKALEASLFKKIFHVVFRADAAVLKETIAEFSYTVPLNHEAILCGLLLGLVLAIIFEFIKFMIAKLFAAIFRIKPALSAR